MTEKRFWFGLAAAVAAGSPLVLIGFSSVDRPPAIEAAAAIPGPPATIFIPRWVPPSTTTTTTTTTTVPPSTTTTIAPARPGRCVEWEPLLEAHARRTGWDVSLMSRIAYRESNCETDVRSRTSDTGIFQINDINHDYLSRHFQVEVTVELLADPYWNIAAAAQLCIYWTRQGAGCYQPWEATRED